MVVPAATNSTGCSNLSANTCFLFHKSLQSSPRRFIESEPNKGGVIKTEIIIRDAVHIIRGENIIVVTYLDGADIDIAIKKEMHAAYQQITAGKPHLFLFEAAGTFWITREAREYAAQQEIHLPFKAVAVVARTLGYRILADFYARFYKPKMPYGVFKNSDDARKWLLEQDL